MSNFKAKMLQIRFLASVRPSLCPSVRLLDGGWHLVLKLRRSDGEKKFIDIFTCILPQRNKSVTDK